ncbi:MAG TPA: amidohydrolase [Phycisphaerae bacterium]|nr:amidohydrolase [Phycisphaerae bacterium]HRW55402.1 amidohydrolase [Phycisphaerae bacterium]
MSLDSHADLILKNGRITTLDDRHPDATRIAFGKGRVLAVDDAVESMRGANTRVVDVEGRRVIPGLNDSHLHVIRGGLNYNMELRWDGIWSLADALELLRLQALRTPAPQWVRVVGGWSEFQFRERRMPTLDEINAAAPDVPVFILNLYSSAMLNRAALRALGYDRQTPDFDRGEVVRDKRGAPTGLLLARPSAMILYQTLALGPKLGFDDQLNSTRQFMRELNRLGLTSIIDAGGGAQNYPEDYQVIQTLRERDQLTLRISYDLFAQKPGRELEDFRRWTGSLRPGQGDEMLRLIGAGENLTWAAADFEIFTEPRPDLAPDMESQLEPIVRTLAEARWPFRIHATYDESISRFLDVFERVNRDTPFEQSGESLHWFIDHAETISDRNIDRIAAMRGGIAVQHRMMYQGEYFLNRYGADQLRRTPPLRRILDAGLPMGGGTDATRVASYNPWVSLQWMVTGRTLGGLQMYDDANLLSREEALHAWTRGSAWFSSEEDCKGSLTPGAMADVAVLSADFMTCPAEAIRDITSVLTIVEGRIVHGTDAFAPLAPPPPPVSPDWAPVAEFGGYGAPAYDPSRNARAQTHTRSPRCGCATPGLIERAKSAIDATFWGASGCDCFAF